MSALLDSARGVLDRATEVFAADPDALALLDAHRGRLGGPLRVALAGSVKSGKSTLLNALVGEQIAPTGVGECTRLVTHYADAPSPRIGVVYRGARRPADPAELPALHRRGSLVLDLERLPLDRVAALHVDWPSQHLRELTLVDTPGVDSAALEGRPRPWVGHGQDGAGDDEHGGWGADVVVHLVRHLHEPDVAFLEAYGDRVAAGVGAAGTLVVLSRADEVGGGRVDAVMAAGQVARRYRSDPALRPWCATTTTVAGLLAETARTLRGVEFTALRTLARLERAELDEQLLTADRFVAAGSGPDAAGLPEGTRLALLDRFGVFGVRLATSLLRRGVDDSAALAAELARRSGLDELRGVLGERFLARRDVFQARAALLAVDRLVRRARAEEPAAPRRPSPVPRPATGPGAAALTALAAELERARSGAHEIVELDLLTTLRRRPLAAARRGSGAELTEEAERLLGDRGPSAAARLGLDEATGDGELRAVALATLARWRARAEDPFADRDTTETARVVVRSVEGLLAARPVPVGAG
ncbi:dynamin family protein [Actinomycetospora sp. TBRC 11914]|uniref:dynamin family protein n=1 Tax=Actinomycetospora sp. TBRC 11914 TaxID=2729387 RepID=UPI00145DDEE3|nr:dynamin family protein [Actinomycetospora sp. TBRC 11914]NMO93006.1 GTP-binding protein [Actinomycetospora sp. TBRC 11914]